MLRGIHSMRLLGLDIRTQKIDKEFRDDGIMSAEAFFRGSEPSAGSMSGVRVNPNSAMRASAVYTCVRLISDSIGSLPLVTYRRKKNGGKERATDHPLYRLLNLRPNHYMTRSELVTMTMWHLLLRGDAFWQIVWNGRSPAGGINELVPLHPDKVTVEIDPVTNDLFYTYRDNNGRVTVYNAADIVHFRGPTKDGIHGLTPIQEAKETIGNAIAVADYEGRTFANSVRIGGILEHPQRLNDETAKRVATSFRAAYGGSSNSGKVAVLEEGMKFNRITMTNQDAQFLETFNKTRSEIAGIFGVPPPFIGDLTKATLNNIEHLSIHLVVYCLRVWNVRLEQTINTSLFADTGMDDYYVEFLVDGLLRGDTKSRYEAYAVGLQNGVLRFNDVADMENRNPYDWGDATMVPLNMRIIRSEKDLDNPDTTQTPTNEPDNDDSDDNDNTRSDIQTSIDRLQLINGARNLTEFILKKAANREVLALTRESSTAPEKVAAFFVSHRNYLIEELEPVYRLFNDDSDTNQVVATWVDSFLDTRKASLAQALKDKLSRETVLHRDKEIVPGEYSPKFIDHLLTYQVKKDQPCKQQ